MGSQSAALTRETVKRSKQRQKPPSSIQATANAFVMEGFELQRELAPMGRTGALTNSREIPLSASFERGVAPFTDPLIGLPIQRKLAIGAVNDPLEAEADRMAEHIVSMSGGSPTSLKSDAHALRRKCACQDGGRQCTECEEGEGRGKKLRRKEQNAIASMSAPPVVHEVLRSPGQPLDPATRAFMEPRFGHDFSHVRVHTDPRAAESARSVDASAYTLGSHVVFNKGQYAPESGQGQRLLAHELTHVVQQGSSTSGIRSQRADGNSGQLSPIVRRSPLTTGDPIHDPLIAQFRRDHGLPPGGIGTSGERVGPSDGEIKYSREYEQWLLQGKKSDSSSQTKTAAPGPIDCSTLFESRQIASFGGAAGPWKLNELTKTIVDALSTCELAYVMIDVVPKPGGDDPRGDAGARAEQVRKALMQWIGPNKFTEDRFQTGLSSGNDDGSEVTVYLESRARVVSWGNGGGRPAPAAPKDQSPIQGWQWVLAAGGQIAWHVSLASGKPAATPEDVTFQFQVARNFVGHPDKESGSELQGLFQIGYNITTEQVTGMSGVQYTEVLSLFNGLLQIAGFAQVLAGVAAGKGGVDGVIQPSIGAQAMVQVGPLQLGVMIFRGLTLTPGGGSTQDTGGGIGAQFSFK
jgi:hypothetical protein